MYEMIAIDITLYIFAAIMITVTGMWAYLLRSMMATFKHVPFLDDRNTHDSITDTKSTTNKDIRHTDSKPHTASRTSEHVSRHPMVSVILPARNEEDYIERCLESLAAQDYPNYEIIAIDDSSDDTTWQRITECAKKYPDVIVPVSAKPKPDGWMGKNWACMEGYHMAKGDLLLFTDADTCHRKSTITLAVGYLQRERLDALTVMPRMLAPDFWIKTTLPMISVFLHTRFSALNVNDPDSKTGYFFGSFFILGRKTYRAIGTHESVKKEMIEDGALGRKTKEAGHRMRMVRGEHLIEAVWARDITTLWNALKRLMIPLRVQNGLAIAAGIAAAIGFLLFVPFVSLAATAAATIWWTNPETGNVAPVLATAASSAASMLIWSGAILECRKGLNIKTAYGLLAPLGGGIVLAGFVAGLARSNPSLMWRGRTYTARDQGDRPFAAI